MEFTPDLRQKPFQFILSKIRYEARRLYDWSPRKGEEFFDTPDKERFSDDGAVLLNVIDDNFDENDTVLTIPSHKPFFNHPASKAIAFDISITQLKDYDKGESWWCDIFNQEQLETVLVKTGANAIDLSNITEYAEDLGNLEMLARQLSGLSVNKIVWTRFSRYKEGSEVFKSLLEKSQMFTVEEHKSEDKTARIVYFAKRKGTP